MNIRPVAATIAVVALTLLTACGGDSDDESGTSSAAPSSSASGAIADESDSAESSEESEASESESETSTSAPAKDANGREILPDTQPAGFTPDDTSAPFKYGYIVDYVNQYPGWIVLSTEEPEYDTELGGYRVNVYFSAYGGSDIIVRDEFTMEVDGQVYQAEPLQPTGQSTTTDFLADKTPIGNRPDAMKNYAFGDVVFKMPQTQSPLHMHYDNKDGDVHITWAPDGKG